MGSVTSDNDNGFDVIVLTQTYGYCIASQAITQAKINKSYIKI